MSATQEEPLEGALDGLTQETSESGPSMRGSSASFTGPTITPASSRAFGSLSHLHGALASTGLGSLSIPFMGLQSTTPAETPGDQDRDEELIDVDRPARSGAAGFDGDDEEDENSPSTEARRRSAKRRPEMFRPTETTGGSEEDIEGGNHSETLGTPRGTKSVRFEQPAEIRRRNILEKHEQDRIARVQAESERIQEELAQKKREADAEWAAYQAKMAEERKAEDKKAREDFEERRRLATEKLEKELNEKASDALKKEKEKEEQKKRDYEFMKELAQNPERVAAIEAMHDLGIVVSTPKSPSAPAKAKPRALLGVKVDDVNVQVTSIPAIDKGKGRDISNILPAGGYLGAKLAPKPSIQPAQTIPTTSASTNAANNTNVTNTVAPTTPKTPVAKARTAAGGNPGGGGGSSDSSSEDSDYKRMNRGEKNAYKKGKKEFKLRAEQRLLREKMEKLKLSGFKTKLPSAYDGTPNYDTFEQFIYEVSTWIEDTGFNEAEAVRHVKSFLKEKAGTFYMNMVAPNPEGYDMQLLSQELFEYCFPPDIKARLRKKFTQLHQTDRGFKDFVRELRRYQRRLPDITEKQVAQRVWDGAHGYLRIEWARTGYNAENNTVEQLEESGM